MLIEIFSDFRGVYLECEVVKLVQSRFVALYKALEPSVEVKEHLIHIIFI
jgi:hypothetical protein